MKLAVELYAEKPFFVKENGYFRIGLRTRGLINQDSIGEDRYKLNYLLLSGRRLAGSARKMEYDYKFFPGGLGSGQARPGAYVDIDDGDQYDLALVVETDIVLNDGLFRDQIGIRLVNENGKAYDIMLARPDIEISWNGRGRYVIPLAEFVNSKLFCA